MAELDYAFIAEFAKVETGKLTAIGASYLEVRPPSFPASHTFSVAGRIRAPEDAKEIALTVRINPPGNVNMVVNGTLVGFAAGGAHVLRVWTIPGPLPSFMHSGDIKVKSAGWKGRRW